MTWCSRLYPKPFSPPALSPLVAPEETGYCPVSQVMMPRFPTGKTSQRHRQHPTRPCSCRRHVGITVRTPLVVFSTMAWQSPWWAEGSRAHSELPQGQMPSWLEPPAPKGSYLGQGVPPPASKSSAADSRTSRRPQLRVSEPRPPEGKRQVPRSWAARAALRACPAARAVRGPCQSTSASPRGSGALCPHCSVPCCHSSLCPCAGLTVSPKRYRCL